MQACGSFKYWLLPRSMNDNEVLVPHVRYTPKFLSSSFSDSENESKGRTYRRTQGHIHIVVALSFCDLSTQFCKKRRKESSFARVFLKVCRWTLRWEMCKDSACSSTEIISNFATDGSSETTVRLMLHFRGSADSPIMALQILQHRCLSSA